MISSDVVGNEDGDHCSNELTTKSHNKPRKVEVGSKESDSTVTPIIVKLG